jgi:hypothetical protein
LPTSAFDMRSKNPRHSDRGSVSSIDICSSSRAILPGCSGAGFEIPC